MAATIGRANLDGSSVDQSFVPEADGACGVAVDGRHVYWANQDADAIGRAKLDGSAAIQSFITGATNPCGVAVDGAHVYWDNDGITIGRANLDGSSVDQSFIGGADSPCGVAVDAPPFSFGKLKRNKRKGTAKLTVIVPGPGELELAKTKKVRGAEARAEGAGDVKLAIKRR